MKYSKWNIPILILLLVSIISLSYSCSPSSYRKKESPNTVLTDNEISISEYDFVEAVLFIEPEAAATVSGYYMNDNKITKQELEHLRVLVDDLRKISHDKRLKEIREKVKRLSNNN